MTRLPLSLRKPRYEYGRHADGCDDLWVIYDVHSREWIASIPFWDCDPQWAARSERRAQRWVARLNRRRPLLSGRGR